MLNGSVIMKLSVVIPVRNEERNLPYLLQSLQKQDFPKKEFEIIVVDTNSTDRTVAIAKRFGAKVINENRLGIPYARNTGARCAKGEIILGTDSDCVLPRNYLKRIYHKFASNPKIVGLSGFVDIQDALWIIRVGANLVGTYGHFYSKLFRNTPVCWALNFAYRKKAFEACNGYNLSRPLLLMGINAHASDEYVMADRLINTGGRVIFDKTLRINTSGRRFKNRILYWLVMEHLVGLVLNEKLYNLLGFVIPVPSYSKRIYPKRFYRLAKATILSSAILILSYSTVSILETNNQAILKKQVLASQINYKKYEDLLMLKLKSILPQNESVPTQIRDFVSS